MTFEIRDAPRPWSVSTDPASAVVLRGAGDKAFVSGTDIRQFLEFKTREHVLAYEARIGRILGGSTADEADHRHGAGDAVGGLYGACVRSPAGRDARAVPVARPWATVRRRASPPGRHRGPIGARELGADGPARRRAGGGDHRPADEVHPADRWRAGCDRQQIATSRRSPWPRPRRPRVVLAAYAVKDAEDLLLSCYLSEDLEGVHAFLESGARSGRAADASIGDPARAGPRRAGLVDVAVVGAGLAGATAAPSSPGRASRLPSWIGQRPAEQDGGGVVARALGSCRPASSSSSGGSAGRVALHGHRAAVTVERAAVVDMASGAARSRVAEAARGAGRR
jgi:hypothetical protein